ncbi:MAG: THUMP-like domain-containing protein [Cytophagales bacterium]
MLPQEIRNIIIQNRHQTPQEVALKLNGKGYNLQLIVQQIEGWQKAKEKLPTWHKNDEILFPIRLSVEQCSSEITAAYKAQIIKGGNLVDITGGFGVDSYYLSKNSENTTYVEQNNALFDIVKYNFEIFQLSNIKCLNRNGLDFVFENSIRYDAIFIDPARRDNDGKKVFQLADCEPNIIENIDLLFTKSDKILVKTAPLLDIDKTIKDLKFVKEVHIVSVDNECKEVLYLLENEWVEEEKIITVNISKNQNQHFSFLFSDERKIEPTYSQPLKYLYEPNASILKSGAFKSIAQYYNLKKVAQHTHFYTSTDLLETFPGRKFEILFEGNEKEILKKLNGNMANVIVRNYPLSAEALRKKMRIKDGGDLYVVGFQLFDAKNAILLAQRM